MCGRYVSSDDAAIERFFHVGGPKHNPFRRLFNAAPTMPLPVYGIHTERGPEVVPLHWSLIPSWAKDPKAHYINAKAETLSEKPAFRAAFRRRRCLVPMLGFYEWQKVAGRKVPHYVHPLNSELFAAAGLYEHWLGAESAEPIESYTIITTDANAMMARLHNRMPVILSEANYEAWLAPKNEKTDTLQKLLKPYPAEEMRAYPISARVNDVKNDGPKLIDPV